MKKYIVLYRAQKSAMDKMKDMNPEDSKKGMEAWMAWAQKCGDGLVDLGAPLGMAQNVTPDGASPSDLNVVGYSILQANDMAGAQAMLEGHPHLAWDAGCEISVHETLPMPS